MARTDKDPRPTAIIADILDRLSVPRSYAGDWGADQAERILDALYKGGYRVIHDGPGMFPQQGPRRPEWLDQ